MKKISRFSLSARTTVSTLFLLSSLVLFGAIPLVGARTENRANMRPPSVTITPEAPTLSGGVSPGPNGQTATWTGQATAPGGGANTEAACIDGVNCEVFTLTVLGQPADWNGQKVQVQLNWASSLNEYDIYIHQGTLAGPVINSAMAGPGLTNQTAFIDVGTYGTGTFVVHVVYDTTPNVTDHYTGVASAVPASPAKPPPAPQDAGPKIGYENFEPPGVLTPVTGTSSGGLTVEYLGRNGIEPSIGANWNSGVINYQSDLETLFLTFDDSCPAGGQNATWVNRRAPTSQVVDSDPIGFTDHQTNRVFAAELTLLSPDTVKISHSDDDGVTWVPDQTGGIASAVDHETLGGGPYHQPLPSGVNPVYPNAVYYCSQDIATALCSRSDDGGSTYGPSVPIYNLTACGGLHGHVKVSPLDGTVYVPNRACGTSQSVVVSQDNGITWAIHPVIDSTTNTTAVPSNVGTGDDPALAIDSNGRVYFGFANAGTAAGVAVSDDLGVNWRHIYDVGAVYGLNNVCFPSAAAGDAGRAAIAFYGSTTPQGNLPNGGPATGDSNTSTFTGVWHLYVAHTFDGGNTWTTTDVTPNLPMQRSGLLRGGGADIVRNLADFFDITIDKDGRVLVGYGNGCAGGNCAQAPIAADGTSLVRGNAYSATASIARQSSGRRMLAAHDPASPTSVPGMPFVTERRIGNSVRLAWNEADTGNSTITNYQIRRGAASGAETLLATIPGTQGSYDDITATDLSKTYYYQVVAVNAVGSSCPNNEIAAPYVGDTCTGIIIHKNDPTHPESTGGTASQPPTPQLLIDYVAVGEPPGTNDLLFKIKVGNLSNPLPPSSRWRIAWDWFDPSTSSQMYYVGMNTDQNSVVTFEYGTLSDAGVPAVLVLGETKLGVPAGSFNSDGTITMTVPKSGVGNPQPGDLLGAIGGKTMTGDTPATVTFERSTSFVDHTFIKGQTDNAYPAATYTVVGNTSCSSGAIVPVSAVSRKTHGSAGTFDIDLPLTGAPGIECRTGPTSGTHQVIVTFAAPVTLTGATVTPGAGATASIAGPATINNSQVAINLTNVSNAQTFTIVLQGVSDGVNSGDVAIPMSVLLGDVNGSRRVDSGDTYLVRQQTLKTPDSTNFRDDVNTSGRIDSGDVTIVQQQSLTALP